MLNKMSKPSNIGETSVAKNNAHSVIQFKLHTHIYYGNNFCGIF